MIRALLDTDVVLDLLLDRTPFADAAEALWEAHRQGQFAAFISPITPVNVFYITQKVKGLRAAHKAVADVLTTVLVCPADHMILASAMTLAFDDFEDAVQHSVAAASGLDAIITRNLADYARASIPVYSPTDFLNLLSSTLYISKSIADGKSETDQFVTRD